MQHSQSNPSSASAQTPTSPGVIVVTKVELPPRFPPREVRINDIQGNANRNAAHSYKSNVVSTTKYNLLTFLPKNLFEQFRRVANFYFLLSAILQVIPVISPTNPATSFVPIVIVLFVSAVKEAVEDYRRYKADQVVNNSPAHVLEGGQLVERKWKDIAVGDLLMVKCNESLPADIVMFYSANPDGIAYIETSNLDGETTLKQKRCIQATQKTFTGITECSQQQGQMNFQGPILDLYTFEGKYVDGAGSSHALTNEQMILRGSSLRNTDFIYGIVAYTGHETKLMLNAGAPPSKRSMLEKQMNTQVLLMFALEGCVCFISSVMAGVFRGNTVANSWYLETPFSSAVTGILSFFTFIILYNTMIPISLYVSLEIVKLAQVLFIWQDCHMYYAVNDTPARARTSNLNEELGQVEYIFTDKTGTLTRNVMEFMKCSVGGVAYGRGVTEIEAANAARQGRHLPVTQGPVKGYNFDDPSLLANLESDSEAADYIYAFLTMLAVNHAVIPDEERAEDGSTEIVYKGPSPDEIALVFAAKQLGFEFVRRTPTSVTIRLKDAGEQTYEVLNLLEFTSKRARSSIIVRTPAGQIILYSKGADSVMMPLLSPSNDPALIQSTTSHLTEFASQGLRTLVFASRVLDEETYQHWSKAYHAASISIGGSRAREMGRVADEIERDLMLVGATAIEDKLQEGVPHAIAALEEANIKVWMLTGDKQETAINIGYACSLITQEFTKIIVNGSSIEDTRAILEQQLQKYQTATADTDHLGLVIDGHTLGYIFDLDQQVVDNRAGKRILLALFTELADKCRAVVCCRMSPKQKALVVQAVRRSRKPQPCTLAIGDGANDVPMIQQAHLGVGISGEEGLQAVRAADFSIAQFRFLVRLLLVHGRLNYRRNGKMVLYFFYKNLTFTLCQLWFGIFCGFSGQTLFEEWHIAVYNIVFTALPIIFTSIFDTDIKVDSGLAYPKLYTHGQRGKEFTMKLYWLWVLRGFFDSLVCFFVCYFAIGGASAAGLFNSGRPFALTHFGETVLFAVVFTVTLTLAFELRTWNVVTALGILSAYVGVFGWAMLLGYLYDDSFSNVPQYIAGSGNFWFCCIIAPCICQLPAYAINYIQRNYYPQPYHIIQERAHGYMPHDIMHAPAGISMHTLKTLTLK